MNSKVKTDNTLSRKDWRKSVRRAARKRCIERKRAAKEKAVLVPKRYDMIAQWHPNLNTEVQEIIKKSKIKYRLLTDRYMLCSDITDGACKEIQDLFKDCKFESSDKKRIIKVSFSRWKTKAVIITEKPERKRSNNTDEAKQAAKSARKNKNKVAHVKFKKLANNEAKKTSADNKIPEKGRNRKKLLFRYTKNKKTGAKVNPAIKESNLEKKIRQRVAKALKFLKKKEMKAAAKPTTKYPNKTKHAKPVQKVMNLAA